MATTSPPSSHTDLLERPLFAHLPPSGPTAGPRTA